VRKSGASGRAGVARWLAIHDELLRGIAHALGNRAATMSAAAFMLDFEGADVARHAAVLRAEGEALEELLGALRVLPRREESAAEPVMPGDAVRVALAILAHHGDLRGVPVSVSLGDDVPPVYADPIALQHALLVALTAACRAAGAGGRARLDVTSDGDAVHFAALAEGAVFGGETADPEANADAAAWLLEAHGGSATPHAAGCLLQLPTLQAARRQGR
jgi:signal transduction histidine kinase